MIFGQFESAAMFFAKFDAGTRYHYQTLAASTQTANKIRLNIDFSHQEKMLVKII